jgi:hypothetical protein
MDSEKISEVEAVSTILGILHSLSTDERQRILDTILTFFSKDRRNRTHSDKSDSTLELFDIHSSEDTSIPFSVRLDVSPKEFLMQKKPKTDVERIACLAFYLTHYRSMPHFKTADLAVLNTEAAQPKFSNAAYAVGNAAQYGYLVPAVKGSKQLSALGEQFVLALPDRNAAKSVMASRRGRAKRSGLHNAKKEKGR